MSDPAPRPLKAHPAGLYFIAAAQGAWYFSRYSTQAILVLYLAHVVYAAPQGGAFPGVDALRRLLSWEAQTTNPQALASTTIGLLALCMIPTQILGGFLSDRFLGRRYGAMTGLVFLTLAPVFWAFDKSFILALPCFVLGLSLAVNLFAQVGDLYVDDDPRRPDAYQIMSLVQEAAVIIGPTFCGWLAARYGWHYGFAAAGSVMLAGTLAYGMGWRHLPSPAPSRDGARGHGSSPLVLLRLGLRIALLIPMLAMIFICNEQIYDTYLIWGEQHYDRHLFGWVFPASWLMSLDAGVSFITQIIAIAFWRFYTRHRGTPGEWGQIVSFGMIGLLAPLVLAYASVLHSDGGQISMSWGLIFHFVNDLAMATIMPISLALFIRLAPVSAKSMAAAAYALVARLADIMAGQIGQNLPGWGSTRFWLFHTAVMAIGLALLITARSLYKTKKSLT
ncbi:MFS transporter [Asaia spathodeae]|uniref:MFS transporter n=1 Tax=Asaia spathodeae TaxID=657016 RepID=A0ABX2P7G5_9PROT|nr:MFS transporter [Asaia spathodeae]GBR18918.1 major facilitator superfamily transporter [Asaia spathodeae NBRC 105894]